MSDITEIAHEAIIDSQRILTFARNPDRAVRTVIPTMSQTPVKSNPDPLIAIARKTRRSKTNGSK